MRREPASRGRSPGDHRAGTTNSFSGVNLDRAMVFTGHFPDAKRRASIHALCEALLRRGWILDFVTVGQSPVSRFNSRSQWPHTAQRPVNQWTEIATHLYSYVWRAPFHPFNLRNNLLNQIVTPLFSLYPRLLPGAVRRRAQEAKLILFEGPVSTTLMGSMRALAPDALLIYNAADRLRTVGAHPLLSQLEMRYAPLLDLVRVPAQLMTADYPCGTPVVYIPHGLDKASFSGPSRNPFSTSNNAIMIGDMLFDPWVLEGLAESFPDWQFHVFGVGSVPAKAKPNMIVHGEQPFSTIIPYIQHADIGLAPYRRSSDAGYLSQSSLKMIQYTYCRLSIVVPFFAADGRAHACGYKPGDTASLCDAFARAIGYDRRTIESPAVSTWDEVLDQMLDRARSVRQGRCSPAARSQAVV